MHFPPLALPATTTPVLQVALGLMTGLLLMSLKVRWSGKSAPVAPPRSAYTTPPRKYRRDLRFTDSQVKRLQACLLIQDGHTVADACRIAGLNRSSFHRAKWYKRFQEGGPDALLEEGRGRSRTKIQWTPRTEWLVSDRRDSSTSSRTLSCNSHPPTHQCFPPISATILHLPRSASMP